LNLGHHHPVSFPEIIIPMAFSINRAVPSFSITHWLLGQSRHTFVFNHSPTFDQKSLGELIRYTSHFVVFASLTSR